MATRTVRLDDEAEAALRQIRETTGLPISQALKQGLSYLRERVAQEPKRTPFDVYQTLRLGRGGYAIAPSTQVQRAVRRTLKKKLHR